MDLCLSKKKNNFNDTVHIVKALSILSVICAHCNSVNPSYSESNLIVSDIIYSLGSIGIFVFYFFSGYFLHFTKKSPKEFWKGKINSIFLPWLFCGTLVYFYVYLRKGGISLFSWSKWIAGFDTYLYFLFNLVIMYLLIYPMRNSKKWLSAITLLSVAGNLYMDFTGNSVFFQDYPYVDPLRFIYMFSLGTFFACGGYLDKLAEICRKYMYVFMFAFAAAIVFSVWSDFRYSYFKPVYIPFVLLSFCLILGLAQNMSKTFSGIFIKIGKVSFSIYLLHMPVAGVVAHFFDMADMAVLTALRPLTVLTVTCAAIYCAKTVSRKTGLEKTAAVLLGLR